MDLRDYQLDCVDAVFSDWSAGINPLAIEVAVGGGKTVIAAEVIRRTLAANPNAKIVTLAHRRELLKGMQKTVAAHCGVQVGIVDGQVAPAMRKRHLEAQVVCINTATLGISKKARGNAGARLAAVTGLHNILGNVDLVVLDECHRANTDTAIDCLTELGCFTGTRLLGMTGTLFRTDKKMLTDVFVKCSYKKDILTLIKEGYLSDVIMKKAHVDGMDLTKVATSRSMSVEDFNATDLDKVMEAAGAEGVIAEFAKRYCTDRKTLVFTPTVAAAERVAVAFTAVGLDSRVVHGSMSPTARAEALEDFENGDLQYLINCMLITEGTDLPSCSAIIMARPTKSNQLYIQILGRSLRLSEGKENALIIDLVGATAVNGLVTANSIFDAKPGESATDAATRQAYIAGVVQAKATAVHSLLPPDVQDEYPLETIVSGSFNLFDCTVDEVLEQITKASKEAGERKERERVKKLPEFPPVTGRCGSLLELDLDFLLSLESWATLPNYKGSYAAGLCYSDRWYAFYCDKSKKFDNGRYGFIIEGADSFEDMERAIVKFTESFPGTAGAVYYAQNKLDPNNAKRNKRPSADQLKFMVNLLSRAGIRAEEVADMKNKQMKQPNLGVVLDAIDYLLLAPDARKQIESVKEYLRGES